MKENIEKQKQKVKIIKLNNAYGLKKKEKTFYSY